ncbi:hypothetical protein D3C79_898350 [compost metagenome]
MPLMFKGASDSGSSKVSMKFVRNCTSNLLAFFLLDLLFFSSAHGSPYVIRPLRIIS